MGPDPDLGDSPSSSELSGFATKRPRPIVRVLAPSGLRAADPGVAAAPTGAEAEPEGPAGPDVETDSRGGPDIVTAQSLILDTIPFRMPCRSLVI